MKRLTKANIGAIITLLLNCILLCFLIGSLMVLINIKAVLIITTSMIISVKTVYPFIIVLFILNLVSLIFQLAYWFNPKWERMAILFGFLSLTFFGSFIILDSTRSKTSQTRENIASPTELVAIYRRLYELHLITEVEYKRMMEQIAQKF